MDRKFYLELAKNGVAMPIGADLTLKEKADHEERLFDGARLGDVIIETAARYKTPLAFPLMDLTVEKEWLMKILGVPEEEISTKHFETCPSDAEFSKVMEAVESAKAPPTPRMKANCDAIKHVAAKASSLVPVGMAIGPFSMMTKLLHDPITAVYMAGMGTKAEEDEEVKTVERALNLSEAIIKKSIRLQVAAGAKAICLCEPAANKVYISPNQLEEGSDVFDRYVIDYNKRIRAVLEELGADLVFHDCGELTDSMVKSYNQLDPAVMSFGSSRTLWEDAKLVKKDTVLFGNLPTKKFYSDNDITKEQVSELSKMILVKMKESGHPFILGSECDVLSVPGYAKTIQEKIDIMVATK